ncbi:MAG: N-acetylmuramoyl-L-alanine amidase [Candidatus Sulfotelmatobacter sp.]
MTQWIGCPPTNFHHGRPYGLRPEAVVVHIMDGSFAAGESVFRDPTTQKSAHYGISGRGDVHQYVDENDTAFHAGIVVNPTWPLLKPRINPNVYTIGIEHEGRPDDIWQEEQLASSARLIGQIIARWGIPLDSSHIIRHHQIRASKTCPGNWLNIDELVSRIGHAPVVAAPAIAAPITLPSKLSEPASVGDNTPTEKSNSVAPKRPIAKSMAVPTVIQTLWKANLRRGKPSTVAPILRMLGAHTDFVACKCEIGERVDGNAYWYADVQGNYLWAGATDTPDPTAR